HVTSTPILRPLLTLDKEEIVTKAKTIGTFDISIQPFEDCCTIFTPKNPITEPDLEKVVNYESAYDFTDMIDRAVDNIETLTITKDYQSEKDKATSELADELF
ncbi:tRNA 4-thiouridine(8) synthase ThiI, partial [Staphylococcus arlettae]